MNFFNQLKYNLQQQGVLAQIIITNVVVFLTVNIIGNLSHLNLIPFVALPVGGYDFLLKFWTLFTYMFSHDSLGHVFWNLLLFYFMSQLFFSVFGQSKLLYVYVMSGLSGAALVLILGLLFPDSFGNSLLLGASAAVLGVGAVMAVYTPDYRVFLFGFIEIPYKYFYLITFAVSTIIDFSVNTGGKISHIGGALFGVLYAYNLKNGKDIMKLTLFSRKKNKLKISSKNNNATTVYKRNDESEEQMNNILDKISKSGYDSLTKKEKEDLFKLSQKNKE
jgi:membrane associated rhomboid family serine protease